MSQMVVDLGLPPAALSPNAASHWGRRFKATRMYRHEAWVAGLNAKRCAKWVWMGDRPVSISIEYRCHRKAEGYKALDATNALAALKAAIDGLIDAGIAKNDSVKWLRLERMDLFTRADDEPVKRLGAGVTITITEE